MTGRTAIPETVGPFRLTEREYAETDGYQYLRWDADGGLGLPGGVR